MIGSILVIARICACHRSITNGFRALSSRDIWTKHKKQPKESSSQSFISPTMSNRVRNCSSMSMTISNDGPEKFGIDLLFIMSISDQKGASRKNRRQKKASTNSFLSNAISMSGFLQRGQRLSFSPLALLKLHKNWTRNITKPLVSINHTFSIESDPRPASPMPIG